MAEPASGVHVAEMLVKHSLVIVSLLAGCGDDHPASEPDVLVLPGDNYYPESINAAPDGTIYVPSLTTGELVAFADGDTEPTIVLAPGSDGVTGITGVLVDGDDLWLCSVDTTFMRPTELRRFGRDGTPKDRFPLAADQFCNDMAFDALGNLFVTDSFGGSILKLPAGGTALEVYTQRDDWKPTMPGAFGLDGITTLAGDIYITKFDGGEVFRDDGSGAQLFVSALANPDAIRALDDSHLLVIEGGAGRLTELGLDGHATPLATDLDQPTSVVVTRGSMWVSQGQLGRLFAMPAQPPILPFVIRRVDFL